MGELWSKVIHASENGKTELPSNLFIHNYELNTNFATSILEEESLILRKIQNISECEITLEKGPGLRPMAILKGTTQLQIDAAIALMDDMMKKTIDQPSHSIAQPLTHNS